MTAPGSSAASAWHKAVSRAKPGEDRAKPRMRAIVMLARRGLATSLPAALSVSNDGEDEDTAMTCGQADDCSASCIRDSLRQGQALVMKAPERSAPSLRLPTDGKAPLDVQLTYISSRWSAVTT